MSVSPGNVEAILERMRVPGKEGLYVLGCFERPATLYMQQVRALNLIYALNRAGTAPSDCKLAVIGAGAAGVTAAAAAAMHGWQVTVIDRFANQVLSLAGSATSQRWLHPHIYEWPQEGKDAPNAGLCVLNWTAGVADKVVQNLRKQWGRIARRYAIETYLKVSHVSVEPMDGRYLVQWNGERRDEAERQSKVWGERKGRRLHFKPFDIVILAVGFGVEQHTKAFPYVFSYWKPDDIGENRADRTVPDKVLISGTGDGGLIDVLRCSFTGFRHEEVLDRLGNEWLATGELARAKERIKAIEQSAWSKKKDKLPYEAEMNYAYHDLAESLQFKNLISFRDDLAVTLTGTSRFPLSLDAAPINRFLFSLTNAEYIPGPLSSFKHARKESCTTPPGPWTVSFEGRPDTEEYQDVIIRHGPTSALQTWFPWIYDDCASLRANAKLTPDPTREPKYDSAFADLLSEAWRVIEETQGFASQVDVREAVMRTGADLSGADALKRYRKHLEEWLPPLSAGYVELDVTLIAKDRPMPDGAPEPTQVGRRETVRPDWLESPPYSRLVTGVPGSGKTTMLRAFALQAAQDVRCFPLYVPAREIDTMNRDSFLVSAFDWCFKSLGLPAADKEVLHSVFLSHLLQGRVMVLVEGLDEAASHLQPRLLEAIARDAQDPFRKNRLVVTARKGGMAAPILGVATYEIMPLGRRQIRELLLRQYPDTEAARPVRDLLDRIPDARWLFQTPQSLHLFRRLIQHMEPENRDVYALVQGLIDISLGDTTAANRETVCSALRELAFRMLRTDGRFTRADIEKALERAASAKIPQETVDAVCAMSIIVAEDPARTVYAFAHRVVHECLAAGSVLESDDPMKVIAAMTFDPDLSETDVPAIAIGQLADPGAAHAWLMAMPDSLHYTVLRLRARATRYCGLPSTDQMTRLAERVVSVIMETERTLTNRVQEVAESFVGAQTDMSVILMSHLKPLLLHSAPIIRIRAIAFLGRTKLPEACTAIVPLLVAENEDVRKEAAQALGELGDPAAIPLLVQAILHGVGDMVFSSAFNAIEQIGGTEAVEALKAILGNRSLYQNLRWPAARALGRLSDPAALDELLHALRDPAEVIRQEAAEAMGYYKADHALEALVGCLKDPEMSVRAAAAMALGVHQNPAAATALEEALNDRHLSVWDSAVRSLASVDRPRALDALQRTLADPAHPMRGPAAAALGEILGREALPALLVLSQDPDSQVRLGAAKGLTVVAGDDVEDEGDGAAQKLLEIAETADELEDTRYQAIRGLVARNYRQAVPVLKRLLLKDRVVLIRMEAARALQSLGGPDCVDSLLKAVESTDVSSYYAARALGELHNAIAIPALIAAWRRSPAGTWMQGAFLTAIGRIGGAISVTALRELFATETEKGREEVIEGLYAMRDPMAVPGIIAGIADSSSEVRTISWYALQSFSHAQLIVGLKAALDDGLAAVRRCAADLIPFYGGNDVATTLEEMACDRRYPEVADASRIALEALQGKLNAIGA